MMTKHDFPTICLLGAALDTGNLGVQALGLATLYALRRRLPRARIVIFSDQPGRREMNFTFRTTEGSFDAPYESIGVSLSRNPFKSGNIVMENVLGRVGFGSHAGIVSRTLANADLLLDFSGGDSFTTLYGAYRYRYTTAPRRMAQRTTAPYVMMPQTYGPFDETIESDARQLLERTACIWSRDLAGQKTIRNLLGQDASRRCPDVAFGLPAEPSPDRPESNTMRVGLNVSGLLFNGDAEQVRRRFGLQVDYRSIVREAARMLLATSRDTELLLVPHVLVEHTSRESDIRACNALRDSLASGERSRTIVAGAPASACAAKGLIATCDFFVGSRMHSCIAALSSGVPATAIAYSGKSQGVFEMVGMGHAVLDARELSREGLLEQLHVRFADRQIDRTTLTDRLPEATNRIDDMFDSLLDFIPPSEVSRAA